MRKTQRFIAQSVVLSAVVITELEAVTQAKTQTENHMKARKGDWVAVLLRDGSTPVGEVVSNRNGLIEIELISAITYYPMDEYRQFSSEEVVEYAISHKKDAWIENGQVTMPDEHLWSFQRAHNERKSR